MAKYFSSVDYFATGEGKYTHLGGGTFADQDDFLSWLEKRVDPSYLRHIDIYTADNLPAELLNLLRTRYPMDIDIMLNGTGIYRFQHEFYFNAF